MHLHILQKAFTVNLNRLKMKAFSFYHELSVNASHNTKACFINSYIEIKKSDLKESTLWEQEKE